MSTVKLELHLSSEDLLKAVEQLSQPDLEEFVSHVIAENRVTAQANILWLG